MRSELAAALLTPLVATVVLAAPAWAQSEAALRAAFEGTSVSSKIDLPASDNGIDVYPQRRPALEFPAYARRIKQYGTSVRAGEPILVTKVRVKKNLIEFQLGGGGYGTFSDDTGSDVSVPSALKTQREKSLEADLKRETDRDKRRRMQEELDQLRRDRQREDARNNATVAAAEELKKQNVRQRRLEGGSRFNVRFADYVPDGALTPEGLREALAEWVDFGGPNVGRPVTLPGLIPPPPIPPLPTGVAALHKGLTRAEVEMHLGPPIRVVPRREGTLSTESAEFRAEGNRVQALFVEGVLVRYTITSQ
jgi:hypothetical protein